MAEEDIEFTTLDGDDITKSDIRDEIQEMYLDANTEGHTKITDFSIGSEAYHLIDTMANLMLEHIEMSDDNAKQLLISTAEGEFLDSWGDRVGVHRGTASASEGVVTFSLPTGYASENTITIPVGTVVSTGDAIGFTTETEVILNSTNLTGTAEVVSEEDGEYNNVLAGTIVHILSDSVPNIVTVSNESAMTGATDIEEDDPYRQRLILAPFNFPVNSRRWFMTAPLDDESVAEAVSDLYSVKSDLSTTDMLLYFKPTTLGSELTDCNCQADLREYENDDVVMMTKAECRLKQFFNLEENDIVGLNLSILPASSKTFLVDEEIDGVEYSYAIAVMWDSEDYPNATLSSVSDSVRSVIAQFNDDGLIGNSFVATNLAVLIEEQVEEVTVCRIVQTDGENYREVTDEMQVNQNEYYIANPNVDIIKASFKSVIVRDDA